MITVCKTGNLPMTAPFIVTIIRASVFHICFHPIDEMLDFLVSILNVANNGLFNGSKGSGTVIKDIQDFGKGHSVDVSASQFLKCLVGRGKITGQLQL